MSDHIYISNGSYVRVNEDYIMYVGDGTHLQSVVLPDGLNYDFYTYENRYPNEGQVIYVHIPTATQKVQERIAEANRKPYFEDADYYVVPTPFSCDGATWELKPPSAMIPKSGRTRVTALGKVCYMFHPLDCALSDSEKEAVVVGLLKQRESEL